MTSISFKPIPLGTEELKKSSQRFEDYLIDLMLFGLPITKLQSQALRLYQGNYFYTVNEGLDRQEITEDIDKIVTLIDSAMNYSFDEDSYVYRGANDLDLRDLEVGQVLEYRSYLSTTLSEEKTKDFRPTEFNPILQITIPKEIQFTIPDIYSMAVFGNKTIFPGKSSLRELEILLPRNCKLKITKIQGNKVFCDFYN